MCAREMLRVLQAGVIVAFTTFILCDATIQIVKINQSENNTANRNVILCRICGPGTEPSNACSHPWRTTIEEIIPTDIVIVSSCMVCSPGFYSSWHSTDQRCRKCAICPSHTVLKRNCTPAQDTLCVDQKLALPQTTEDKKSVIMAIHVLTTNNPERPEALSSTPGNEKSVPMTTHVLTTNNPKRQGYLILKSTSAYMHRDVVVMVLVLTVVAILCLMILCVLRIYRCKRKVEKMSNLIIERLNNEENPRTATTSTRCTNGSDLALGPSEIRSDDFIDSMETKKTNCEYQTCEFTGTCSAQPDLSPKCNMNQNLELFYQCQPREICIASIHPFSDKSKQISESDEDMSRIETSSPSEGMSPRSVSSLWSSDHNDDHRDDHNDEDHERKDSGFATVDDIDDAILLEQRKKIGKEGGIFDIEGTSVKVIVPEGAIEGEEKEIYVKVYIGRPNDWRQLKSNGHTIGLSQIDMGPSGTQFNKPIEVVMKTSTYENEEDIEYEFSQGEYNKDTVWKTAIRATSKEKAKEIAASQEPHVSFFVSREHTFAYYMHFTGGRILRKRVKSTCLEGSVFCDMSDFQQGSLNLVVLFYEPTEEGKTVVKSYVQTMRKVVIMEKLFQAKKGRKLTLQLQNVRGDWKIEQGCLTQEVSLDPFFNPEFLGKIASADYILKHEQRAASDFSCFFNVFQQKKHITDLKVKVMKHDSPNGHHTSSGYMSDVASLMSSEEKFIDDSDLDQKDETKYMHQFVHKLSNIMGAHYQQFARNLKIDSCDIEVGTIDNKSDGCRETCYQILKDWVNSKMGEISKAEMIDNLRKALDETDTPYTVKFTLREEVLKETVI